MFSGNYCATMLCEFVCMCVFYPLFYIVITMHCVTCFKNSAQGADVDITAARLSSEYYWVNEGAFNCAFIRYILALTVLKKLYCCSLPWSCSVHKEPYKVALWDIIDWCLTVFCICCTCSIITRLWSSAESSVLGVWWCLLSVWSAASKISWKQKHVESLCFWQSLIVQASTAQHKDFFFLKVLSLWIGQRVDSE